MGVWGAAVQMVREVTGLPKMINLELPPQHTFDTPPRPVDQVLAAMRYGDPVAVTRDQALSVAAVQRGRNELCSLATLPLRLYQGLTAVESPLFRQFDLDVPNVVHMAMTIEDLAFEHIAWWEVVGQDFDGYPMAVRRLDPSKVTLDPPGRSRSATTLPGVTPLGTDTGNRPLGQYVYVDRGDGRPAQPLSSKLVIRFDSPNPGVLKANARAVRIALKLDRLTEMYAGNPALREYFTDNDDTDSDLFEDSEVEQFLAEYGAMRETRPYGWIPRQVKRSEVSTPSPKDLTLVDLHQTVTLAIANGLGVDPEDLGVSTTSRTYFNSVDKKQDKINRVYAPFMAAITDRLAMGDVTRRGYAPRFDLTDFLKSAPNEQADYWAKLKAMNVVDEQWIAEQAGIDPAVATRSTSAARTAPPTVPPGGSAVRPARTFTGATLHFDAADFAGAAVPPPTADTAARTITGLAVPYNEVARKYGIAYRFRPGSLEYSAPDRMPVLKNHADPVGMHKSITDSAAGPTVVLSVFDAVEGSAEKIQRDQLLYDAEHGMYTGLSIGVDFSMYPEDGDVEFNEEDQVYDVVRATWRETSSTHLPAFDNARVTKVAADLTGGTTVDPCPHCRHRHAPNIACATFAAQLAQQAPPPANLPAVPSPVPAVVGAPPAGALATLSAEQLAQFANVYTALTGQQLPAQVAQTPTPVSPHHTPAQVTEPAPYRFDRAGNLTAGSHDFSGDIWQGWSPQGEQDPAARDRANAFVKDTFERKEFAITPANVTALNYPQNKPELYVDQMEFQYPVYDAVYKGTLDNQTPFILPKFNASSGLVADHVSGTEPTPGAFTATSQTITPSAVSGKVEILRETYDQGGNPQASGLIWRQMIRGWYEALEAYVIAQFVAAAASIPDLTITTASADATLDQSIADALIPLQYIRGGDRFRRVFTQVDLYKAMVKAKDTTGRRLYPALGPTNATGTTDSGYATIDAHGKLWIPAWATAATSGNAASSYMFDPEKVCLWASAPQRLDIVWRVAWVDMGLFGYKAFGITDFQGTRELVYDPV